MYTSAFWVSGSNLRNKVKMYSFQVIFKHMLNILNQYYRKQIY